MANDGGPAFPVNFEPRLEGKSAGLSLRDYFAAAALQGVAARQLQGPEDMAQYAWRIADAMLAAREPKQETSSYDCGSGTNCGSDHCVAHGGHGGDS